MLSPWFVDIQCFYALHRPSGTEFDIDFLPRDFDSDDILDPDDWEAIPFRFGPEPPSEIELFRLARECARAWVEKLATRERPLQVLRTRKAAIRRMLAPAPDLPSLKVSQRR